MKQQATRADGYYITYIITNKTDSSNEVQNCKENIVMGDGERYNSSTPVH